MIEEYEKAIINELLDKYERSRSFTGDNKVNQKFVVKVGSMFPQYADHAYFEVFQYVNEAIDIIVRKQLVSAKINKARVCSEVILNTAAIEHAYKYIGRTPKRYINDSILKLLEEYTNRNEILKRYCEAQVERVRSNRPIQYFSGNIRELANILIAVDALFKVEEETYVRDFSVRIFKDSKTFEHISSKVINLIFDYGDFPEKNQVMESLNIVKNPTYVNFKGAGTIVISGQRIDLSALKSDIAVSSEMLADIDRIDITGNSVMTVENLTSFHTADSSDNFIIYLGGFHNRIRREFIKKIYRQNPEIEFYHFGDIDAGGFYILAHLRRQTGIDFMPYKMDLETLKKYRNYSKRLTLNDRERLERLQGSEFNDVIQYMLEHDCKLEQEAISSLKNSAYRCI